VMAAFDLRLGQIHDMPEYSADRCSKNMQDFQTRRREADMVGLRYWRTH